MYRENRANQCVGFLSRLACERAASQGLDVDALLKAAGIPIEAMKNRDAKLEVSKQVRLVGLIADALGDDLFGFYLTNKFELRELGWLYYVAASAETLGEAQKRLQRYCELQNECVRVESATDAQFCITLHYTGLARHTDFHQICSFISGIVMLSRHITASSLSPTEVSIAHRTGGTNAL